MIETDRKKIIQSEFIQTHTLSEADFKKMIAEKMERAKVYAKIQERKDSKEFA